MLTRQACGAKYDKSVLGQKKFQCKSFRATNFLGLPEEVGFNWSIDVQSVIGTGVCTQAVVVLDFN